MDCSGSGGGPRAQEPRSFKGDQIPKATTVFTTKGNRVRRGQPRESLSEPIGSEQSENALSAFETRGYAAPSA